MDSPIFDALNEEQEHPIIPAVVATVIDNLTGHVHDAHVDATELDRLHLDGRHHER